MSLKDGGGRDCHTLLAPLWPHRRTPCLSTEGLIQCLELPCTFLGTFCQGSASVGGGDIAHPPACCFRVSMQSFLEPSTKRRACQSRTQHPHHTQINGRAQAPAHMWGN